MSEGRLTEGEAWAREQLDLLLAGRFSPRSVALFLANSQRRANAIRRSRPDLGRQEVRWAAAGTGVWAALATVGVEPFRRRLWAGLGWWALTVIMLDWHLGMVETEDGRPRQLGPADAATLLRAALVPAVADDPSPLLCSVGFLTDVIDGRLARAAAPTRLGRDLEGFVDAAFLAAALRGARRRHLISSTVAAVEIARLGTGFAYAVSVYLGQAKAPDRGLLGAARISTPLRAAGVIAAGAGHRRWATALVLAGSATGTAGLVQASRGSPRSLHRRIRFGFHLP